MRKEQWVSLAQAVREQLATRLNELKGHTGKLPRLQTLLKKMPELSKLRKIKSFRLPEKLVRRAAVVPQKMIGFCGRCIRVWQGCCRRYAIVPKRTKMITLSVCLTLLVATTVGVQAHVGSFTYVVYVDGEEIGYVTDDIALLAYVEELEILEAAERGLEVQPRQEVEVVREQRKGITENDQQIKDFLRSTIEFDVYAYMIYVNDRPTLAVEDNEAYERVIDKLKSAYISGKDNTVIQAIVLNDKVEGRLELVDIEGLYTVETAAEILLRGTDKREIYLVSRGDSLWSIARDKQMKVSEIQQANPQLNGSEKIMPGDEISLIVSEPIVSVSVTEDVLIEQRIPFDTKYKDDNTIYKGNTKVLEPGQHGKKEVTVRVTRLNGLEQTREVIKEVIVKEPVTALVARGTAPVPIPTGTGRFLWPVAGRGIITSRYGPRGRSFHSGVDIASARGTHIMAADNGLVTQSGWSGGYGNMITIDHGNGYKTRYAHNSSNLVSVGQRVQRGQLIAYMGSTGNSTGPHVHFEVWRNGSHVNPMQFF
jgi:murein DD-endopeptidase MepM/ murein hydrolase activator NlpD